jgi:hypothetical protein
MLNRIKNKKSLLVPLALLLAFLVITPEVQKRVSFSPQTLTAQR